MSLGRETWLLGIRAYEIRPVSEATVRMMIAVAVKFIERCDEPRPSDTIDSTPATGEGLGTHPVNLVRGSIPPT